MGKFAFENRLHLRRRAVARCLRHKRAHFIGQRKVGFVGHGQNVRDLGRGNFFRYALAALNPNLFRGDRLEAPAIVQPIVFRIPENGIDIQKIMSQQLLNARPSRGGHVGVIFHPP